MTLALALAHLLALAARPAAPVQVEAQVRATPEGPVRAWVARLALADRRLSFVVTGPMQRHPGDPEGAEARLIPTDTWAKQATVELAVNANFFARLEGTTLPLPGWTEGLPVDLVGLSRSEGRSVSPPRRGEGQGAPPDPALLIDEVSGGHCPCVVRVATAGESALSGVEDAVAGLGTRNGNPGTLLVAKGKNRGQTAQVAPNQRHPRTAAGVSRDGRTLLLVVVDGRQPGWSIGVTLPELAQMMIAAGAWNAINLDGGGSSAMWYREPGTSAGRILNRPSDGHVRPVGNHLGVRVAPGSGDPRPARRP